MRPPSASIISDNPPIELRAATEADIPFSIELRRQTMTEHQSASGLEPSDAEQMRRVSYRFDCAQMIVSNGVPVGLWKVARDGRRWKLIQVQLERSIQGRGVGRELISRLIAEAADARASLELTVLHANPARRLYERLGFRVVGDGPHEYEMRWCGQPPAPIPTD